MKMPLLLFPDGVPTPSREPTDKEPTDVDFERLIFIDKATARTLVRENDKLVEQAILQEEEKNGPPNLESLIFAGLSLTPEVEEVPTKDEEEIPC